MWVLLDRWNPKTVFLVMGLIFRSNLVTLPRDRVASCASFWFPASSPGHTQQKVRQPKTCFKPAHGIMVLFDLRKLILQTRMRSYSDVWFLVGPFVYFHTSCVRTAKALARLRGCAGSAESSLVAYMISAIMSWAVFFFFFFFFFRPLR